MHHERYMRVCSAQGRFGAKADWNRHEQRVVVCICTKYAGRSPSEVSDLSYVLPVLVR